MSFIWGFGKGADPIPETEWERRLLEEVRSHIQNAFDGDLSSEEYTSESGDTITILSCKDGLQEGIAAHATLGVCLHRKPSLQPGEEIAFEFVGIEYEDSDVVRGILSSCAYGVMDGMPIQPYSCWKDLLPLYIPESKLKHILFLLAYLWGDRLLMSKTENVVVFYLLVCPLSDGEAEFLCGFHDNSVGAEKLMEEFEKRGTDLCDLYRKPIF